MNDMIKRSFLILWLLSLSWLLPAQAQKIIQRDLNPPQRMVDGGGQVTKVEYTNHKMIVYFVSDNQTRAPRPRLQYAQSSQTVYGPGHPNSWRLYDKKGNREYALLYVKNIKAVLENGQIEEVAILDQPEAAQFDFAVKISCEAHFERPGKGVQLVDLVEEDVRFYKSQTRSQQPYNVYDLRIIAYKDDLRNAKPPGPKPPVKPKPKPTTPPVQKPAPKPAPKDSVVAQKLPKKETPKPAPAEKVENFGSKVEAGRTYRLTNLLFKQSAYEIEPESYPELDSLLSIMTQNPTMEIELAGHTDNVGDPKLNVALSQKRVDAVKSYLTNKGIAPSRIQTQAYGGSKPIADNSREETKRLNRRVEVKILKE
ncbi:OmpA family protein [Larkinella sp. C7]|jgi:outer membrane protein OmpA-like peptidoglycan-associated protein|uniref:OmpA family protein n=1 Tax=Larkinella sp. C7 TaxID=2576607 RepID=UPI0011113594|nr:OmpA family protein [Larkinella sp. C7]